jgi:hypothetical protein
MRTRILLTLMIGLVLAAGLSGCAASTAAKEGMPSAENPEFLIHPLRLVTLPLHFVGNVVQYGLVEPLYFGLAKAPEAVGLSVEEQRYLAERQQAWEAWMDGRRRMVE